MKQYRVRITSQAKEHLKVIKNYIAYDLKEPKIAKRILSEIKTALKNLGDMPQRIKKIDEMREWASVSIL